MKKKRNPSIRIRRQHKRHLPNMRPRPEVEAKLKMLERIAEFPDPFFSVPAIAAASALSWTLGLTDTILVPEPAAPAKPEETADHD